MNFKFFFLSITRPGICRRVHSIPRMKMVSSRYVPGIIRASDNGKSLSAESIAKMNGPRRMAILPSSWRTSGFGLMNVAGKGIINETVSELYFFVGKCKKPSFSIAPP